MTGTVSVRKDDLRVLIASAVPPTAAHVEPLNEALARCGEALDGNEGNAPEPELPPGQFGRVELPGYRQHTGWVTEETRFGVQMAVVRDFCGAEVAAAVIGPNSQVVYLPTPLRRPEPQAALPAGDEGSDYRDCTCEAGDYDPDCPEHGEPF